MENLTTWFIGITGLAVLLQAGLLAAMYVAMRKTSTRIEAIADEVKTKALPAIESTQTILTDIRPKLEVIAENLKDTTTHVRDQVHRVDATVTDIIDRTRLQIIRADELMSRTLDRVEQTTDLVHKTVVSPVRQVSGLVHGITAGIEFLLGNRGRKNGGGRESRRAVPQDEMFI